MAIIDLNSKLRAEVSELDSEVADDEQNLDSDILTTVDMDSETDGEVDLESEVFNGDV